MRRCENLTSRDALNTLNSQNEMLMSKIEDLMPHFTQLKASLAERRGPDASSRTVAQHMAATKDEQLDALAVAMR